LGGPAAIEEFRHRLLRWPPRSPAQCGIADAFCLAIGPASGGEWCSHGETSRSRSGRRLRAAAVRAVATRSAAGPTKKIRLGEFAHRHCTSRQLGPRLASTGEFSSSWDANRPGPLSQSFAPDRVERGRWAASESWTQAAPAPNFPPRTRADGSHRAEAPRALRALTRSLDESSWPALAYSPAGRGRRAAGIRGVIRRRLRRDPRRARRGDGSWQGPHPRGAFPRLCRRDGPARLPPPPNVRSRNAARSRSSPACWSCCTDCGGSPTAFDRPPAPARGRRSCDPSARGACGPFKKPIAVMYAAPPASRPGSTGMDRGLGRYGPPSDDCGAVGPPRRTCPVEHALPPETRKPSGRFLGPAVATNGAIDIALCGIPGLFAAWGRIGGAATSRPLLTTGSLQGVPRARKRAAHSPIDLVKGRASGELRLPRHAAFLAVRRGPGAL